MRVHTDLVVDTMPDAKPLAFVMSLPDLLSEPRLLMGTKCASVTIMLRDLGPYSKQRATLHIRSPAASRTTHPARA